MATSQRQVRKRRVRREALIVNSQVHRHGLSWCFLLHLSGMLINILPCVSSLRYCINSDIYFDIEEVEIYFTILLLLIHWKMVLLYRNWRLYWKKLCIYLLIFEDDYVIEFLFSVLTISSYLDYFFYFSLRINNFEKKLNFPIVSPIQLITLKITLQTDILGTVYHKWIIEYNYMKSSTVAFPE